MDITLTKDNWDEVGKILRDFVESSDEIAICHHDYSEAYIGRVFDVPRRGVFTIMGTTVDDTRISVGLGDVLEVYEDTIWFHVSEEDEIRLTKRVHTEEGKRLCGLSMKDGVQLTLKVSLNYPEHPIKQFPLHPY